LAEANGNEPTGQEQSLAKYRTIKDWKTKFKQFLRNSLAKRL
jgi:hypothetical protein